MDHVLGWIGQIFEVILSIFPHIVIIRSTHQGICFSRGKHVILWKPGLHWYIPLISEYEEHSIVRSTKTLPKQLLTTNDDKIVGINGVVVYTIDDLYTLITTTDDWSDIIRDHSIDIISTTIWEHTSDDLKVNFPEFRKILLNRLKEDLKEYGIRVRRISFTNIVFLNFSFGNWNIDNDLPPGYETTG